MEELLLFFKSVKIMKFEPSESCCSIEILVECVTLKNKYCFILTKYICLLQFKVDWQII